MKHRIVAWASVGILIACGWMVCALLTFRGDYEGPMSLTERAVLTFAYITCPVLLTHAHFAWVIPANAATYALLGLIVGTTRRG